MYVLRMKVTHNWIGGTTMKLTLFYFDRGVEWGSWAHMAGIRISFRHHAALRLVYRITNFKYLYPKLI